jgi:transcriptional regulator GlxA family with amidase domain
VQIGLATCSIHLCEELGAPPTCWRLGRLRALNTVEVVDDQRWVDEGPVVTLAGVSAGIDMALHLVGRLWGAELARGVQKAVEYFPDPPYADVPLPVTVSAR